MRRRVRWTGPLEPFAEGYASELAGLGYTSESIPQQLRLVARLSAWLGEGLTWARHGPFSPIG